ncbi:hypothetical protein D1007_13710 [Hordeum vulgare]|nr:hypothetical protein D1007_13710 [Hordeum vulgare]
MEAHGEVGGSSNGNGKDVAGGSPPIPGPVAELAGTKVTIIVVITELAAFCTTLELELLEEMGGSPLIDLDRDSDEEDRVRLEREKSLREFILKEIKKVVIDEIGQKVVVQIVTDNGSNYKKACKDLVKEYPHIYWQPCAAHTVNLMLKDIGKFHEDKFRQWMVSDEWKNSEWKTEEEFDYIEACLTSSEWWNDLKRVLDRVQPLYNVLRYADQQKDGIVSSFKLRMMTAVQELTTQLSEDTYEFEKYMRKVGPRIQYLYDNTLMLVAVALDPESHYSFAFDKDPAYINKVLDVIANMADTPQCGAKAMDELSFYSRNKEKFGGVMARLAARTSSPDKEVDPCALMMDLAQYNETNPIMDWMSNSRSETEPLLDEGGSPSQFVHDIVRDVCSKRKRVKVSSLVRRKKVKKGKMAVLDEEAEASEREDDEEEDQESGDEEYVNDEEEEEIGEMPSPGRHIQGIEPGEKDELARVTEEAREACKSKRSAGPPPDEGGHPSQFICDIARDVRSKRKMVKV